MLNAIWAAMIVVALICGALTGQLGDVSRAMTESAGAAVTLAIGLVGMMALWIGLMKILDHAGTMRLIARALRPIMVRLFPDVPADHPAMSMMILNFAANMLGLANAATPFGIKAIGALNDLNEEKGTASNAMALFLAINTSNLALMPSGVIALRASLGSSAPGSIILTTLLATAVSTAVGITAAKLYQRVPRWRTQPKLVAPEVAAAQARALVDGDDKAAQPKTRPLTFGWLIITLMIVELVVIALGCAVWSTYSEQGAAAAFKQFVEQWLLVLLMLTIVFVGIVKRTQIYDAVVEGGKEGFQVGVRIIPFLVAILVAVGMLKASGAIDLMVQIVGPITSAVGLPAEVLPMALIRPLSGNGAYGVAAAIMNEYGPDSFVGQVVSTMQGSTETTFYVLAVYFGSVQIKRIRHTLAACLTADIIGVLAAAWACLLILG